MFSDYPTNPPTEEEDPHAGWDQTPGDTPAGAANALKKEAEYQARLAAVGNSLQWRHDELGVVSNHHPYDCLINRSFKAQIKENIKAPRHWPLWGEFTGHRWIPRTKGQ